MKILENGLRCKMTKQTREEKRKADLKTWESTKYYNIKTKKGKDKKKDKDD